MDKPTLDMMENIDKLVRALLDKNVGALPQGVVGSLSQIMSEVEPLRKSERLPLETRQALDIYYNALFIVFQVQALHGLGVALSGVSRTIIPIRGDE